MAVHTTGWYASCVFFGQDCKKENLIGKKRKAKAGIEPDSTRMTESMKLVTRNGLSFLVQN